MRATTFQTFTAGVGRQYFVIFPRLEDSRVPTTSNTLTKELELLDAVLDGPLEARLLGLHSQDCEHLTGLRGQGGLLTWVVSPCNHWLSV